MRTKHGAKVSAAWTKELRAILLEGIEDSSQGKHQAQERVKALHPLPQGKVLYPKDFEKWLIKVFEKPSEGLAPWLSFEFWQQEVDNVLVQGIFARNVTREEVLQKLRSVWPKLSISWLDSRTEEVARKGLPRWMDEKFWTTEIDPILLKGVQHANECQRQSVDTVLHSFPQCDVGMLWDRLGRLRKQRTGGLPVTVPAVKVAGACDPAAETPGEPASPGATAQAFGIALLSKVDPGLCRTEIDPVLLRGIRNANQLEREAVDRVLRRFPELRIGTIWARFRRLGKRRKENEHNGPPFRWTRELDERLVSVHKEAGLSAAVSAVHNITGWPRKAILRRAHKLGVPTRPLGPRKRWTMAEFRFAIESLNHMSVREIAEEIGRSEKAVWDMVGQRGIPARFQDGYTMRELAEKLHVRRLSVQKWVEAGHLHRKRNGRIDEASLQSFFYNHPTTLKWPVFDQDTVFWVSELVETESARVNGTGAQTRAKSQNSEEMRAAEVSTLDGTVSNASGSDPSGDRESHSSPARGASPQL